MRGRLFSRDPANALDVPTGPLRGPIATPFLDVRASHSTRAGSGGLCGRDGRAGRATARPFVTLQQARRKVVA
eukprot:2767622-Prymnesium_polylepis.1